MLPGRRLGHAEVDHLRHRPDRQDVKQGDLPAVFFATKNALSKKDDVALLGFRPYLWIGEYYRKGLNNALHATIRVTRRPHRPQHG